MLPDVGTFLPTAITIDGATTFTVDVPNNLINLGPRPTAGWTVYSAGSPLTTAGVNVTSPTTIQITKGGLSVPDQVTYDATDAGLVDADGNTLGAFDLEIPYP